MITIGSVINELLENKAIKRKEYVKVTFYASNNINFNYLEITNVEDGKRVFFMPLYGGSNMNYRQDSPIKYQATPLPWKIEPLIRYEDSEPEGLKIIGSNGKTIANDETYYPWAMTRPNAELIVRAVNAHEDLVKASLGILPWRMRDGSPCGCPAGKDEDEPKGKMPALHSTACQDMREALAKAGVKP